MKCMRRLLWPTPSALALSVLLSFLFPSEAIAAILERHTLPASRWNKTSKNRISSGDVRSFARAAREGGDASLLYEVGEAIAREIPNKLKRKELFEAYEVACLVRRQTRRQNSNNTHYAPDTVVDLCAGCGLLGLFLALMWPQAKVIAMDRRQSAVSLKLSDCAIRCWPQLKHRFVWKVCDLRRKPVDNAAQSISLPSNCIVVACHACGLLTDEVIAAACSESLRPMVLVPCCYATHPKMGPKVSPNPGHPCHSWERLPWLKEGAVNQQGCKAIDDARVSFLKGQGYEVCLDHVDPQITRYNKAISAFPAEQETRPCAT